jgi:hypothetical protein
MTVMTDLLTYHHHVHQHHPQNSWTLQTHIPDFHRNTFWSTKFSTSRHYKSFNVQLQCVQLFLYVLKFDTVILTSIELYIIQLQFHD